MSARMSSRVRAFLSSRVQRGIYFSLLLAVTGCSWFTDFKEQPKIDPWDTPNDSTPPRGNPQGSVSVYGTNAPEFMYARNFQGLGAMASLANPVPISQESVNRGRIAYQTNCAVCHGPTGGGSMTAPMGKISPSFFVLPLGAGSNAANTLTDGYIFGIIRNGRGLMPPYNRIEEPTRWDIVNYVRTLQGKTGIAIDTSHGRPGETGPQFVIGATISAPTRPAPYYAPIGAQAGAREGLTGSTTKALPGTRPAATTDTTKPPTPPPGAHPPATPEAQQ